MNLLSAMIQHPSFVAWPLRTIDICFLRISDFCKYCMLLRWAGDKMPQKLVWMYRYLVHIGPHVQISCANQTTYRYRVQIRPHVQISCAHQTTCTDIVCKSDHPKIVVIIFFMTSVLNLRFIWYGTYSHDKIQVLSYVVCLWCWNREREREWVFFHHGDVVQSDSAWSTLLCGWTCVFS
jgi:hypothetical protein